MEKIIEVDEDLKDLVPLYLQSRREELPRISTLLDAGDFNALWGIAHKLHGSGGGFGLDYLSELGESMERAARACDRQEMSALAAKLKEFLDSVEIRYSAVG
ncbi:MAG: Hpt domain-containing protein [Elusimicrobia bacterium]|nr:Hpt domain-containing protein [Elusimicrobiota bacterium]